MTAWPVHDLRSRGLDVTWLDAGTQGRAHDVR